MAEEFALTSRFKIPVPAEDSTEWLDYLTHWAELNDVMLTVLATKNYVITGLSVSSLTTSLEFSYSAGSVSIDSATVSISAGNGTAVANTFNWVYIQGGVIKISIYPPTGVSYVPIACLQTDATGVLAYADLRPSPPTVNDISIAPSQVNPTSNVNLASGKRILHTDTNVGSNTVMFSNSQKQSLLSWGNQISANDWVTLSTASFVEATAKFAILNCYMATLNADSNGWAILEVKTDTTDDNNVYNCVDYGHPAANVLNASQIGQVNQIMLPLTTDKKFQVRTLIDSLGATGVYYASIQLLGYVV